MCEFKVYLVDGPGAERKEVARNICMARKKNGKLLLVEALGEVTSVEDVTIEEVNTFSQEMILVRKGLKEN